MIGLNDGHAQINISRNDDGYFCLGLPQYLLSYYTKLQKAVSSIISINPLRVNGTKDFNLSLNK